MQADSTTSTVSLPFPPARHTPTNAALLALLGWLLVVALVALASPRARTELAAIPWQLRDFTSFAVAAAGFYCHIRAYHLARRSTRRFLARFVAATSPLPAIAIGFYLFWSARLWLMAGLHAFLHASSK